MSKRRLKSGEVPKEFQVEGERESHVILRETTVNGEVVARWTAPEGHKPPASLEPMHRYVCKDCGYRAEEKVAYCTDCYKRAQESKDPWYQPATFRPGWPK